MCMHVMNSMYVNHYCEGACGGLLLENVGYG